MIEREGYYVPVGSVVLLTLPTMVLVYVFYAAIYIFEIELEGRHVAMTLFVVVSLSFLLMFVRVNKIERRDPRDSWGWPPLPHDIQPYKRNLAEATQEKHDFWMRNIDDLPPAEYVYLIRDVSVTGAYKIGLTTKPSRRLIDFIVKLPFRVHIVHVQEVSDSRIAETYLHRTYKQKHVDGEWFMLSDDEVEQLCSEEMELATWFYKLNQLTA